MKPGWVILSVALIGAALWISWAAAALAGAGVLIFTLEHINSRMGRMLDALDDLVYAFTFTKEVSLAPMLQSVCREYLRWRTCRPRPEIEVRHVAAD